MRSVLTILLCTLALAACDGSHADLLSPGAQTAPVAAPVPTPGPALPTPALSVRVANIQFGSLPFSGPQDAWRVSFEYDYTPDPMFPFLVVNTRYIWASTTRTNTKIWDYSDLLARRVSDEFYDFAWAEPWIVYELTIYAARVWSGDWFNDFCVAQGADYWGSIPDWWQFVPVSPQHPFGTRNCTATLSLTSPQWLVRKTITVNQFTQVTVQ